MFSSIFIIFNIVLLEIILSIDNAAVLATMVKQLPQNQQKSALTYGIIGAYLFRGLALVFASILTTILWLKVIGGLYLIYLGVKSLRDVNNSSHQSKPQKFPFLNIFWSTVIMIEVVDLVFSIDNIFAAVAFTENIWFIFLGVFVGILAIRFATGRFIKLLENFPILEKVAYFVIILLGLRLVSSYWFVGLSNETVDLVFSIITLLSFVIPVVVKKIIKK